MGVGLMLLYGSVGVVIGYSLQKGKSRIFILIASSLTFMVGLVTTYAVIVAFLNMDIIHELTVALNESVKNSENILKAMGKEDQISQLKERNANALKMIKTLAPSILILTSILSAFVTQLLCFPIAKRFGVKVQPWGSLKNLSLPKSLLWYYLIAIGTNIVVHPDEGTYLYTVLINARYILEMFLVLQGLSLLFYFFHQRSVAKGFRVLVVILAFMIPIFHYIIMILGITDIGFDFRKRFEKQE
jgi:uncharacterized protein YybS (DUF2232 family)